ncbi:methyltransferase [Neisseriaceae bacterium B1]
MTEYRNESQQKPPKQFIESAQMSAQTLQQHAQHDTGVIWRGDFHQGKQLLAALKKRVRKPAKTGDTPAETFHKYRLAQSQQARLINSLLIEIQANFQLYLPRAPDVQAALKDVFSEANQQAFLLPLNQLLGYIGAHEWHKQGVFIPALNAKIHVPFGVFSPLRGEYLDLVVQAKLPENAYTAIDIGTGSGVLALVLAQRGIDTIWATDTNPRAIATAEANIARLAFQKQIKVLQQNLLPTETADIIICNPPWLPTKPTSDIETALYDPQHAMLRAVLQQAAAHLNPQGQLWLIMSDLAEHLGLREPNQLNQWFSDSDWQVVDTLSAKPQHAKAQDSSNPLAFARQQETTFLYVLQAA